MEYFLWNTVCNKKTWSPSQTVRNICRCLSEETLKAGSPFYIVSILGEVKVPTQGINV